MRKTTAFFLSAILLISLAGCSGGETSQLESSQTESASLSEAAGSSRPIGSDNSAVSSPAPAESGASLTEDSGNGEKETGPTASKPGSPSAVQPTPPETSGGGKDRVQSHSQGKPSSPPSTAAQTPDPPAKPAEPDPAPAEKEPDPTLPSEPEPPAFDIAHWVTYAKEYGAGIGLALDGTARSCVDTYITAGPKSKYLERDISGLLDWYKEQGFTGFWPWYEKQADGTYWLYIGYV